MGQYVLLALVLLSRCYLVYLEPCEGFADSPSDVTIQQGEGTTISCDHGSIVVHWYQGETEIDGGDWQDNCSCVSERSPGQSSISLTFTNITTANAGTYGCWTSNADGTFTKCNFEVVVTAPPTISLDVDDVEDATLEGNLTITPNIGLGIPEAGITWLHNNNVLSPDTDSRVEISEGGVLTVRDVQASDRGTYTVRASNGIGTDAEASVVVTIDFVDLSEPSFSVENDMVTVTCTATGYPTPTITWEPAPASESSVTVSSTDVEVTVRGTSTHTPCDPEQTYRCVAGGSSQGSRTTCDPIPPPEDLTVGLVTDVFTSVHVTWTPSTATGVAGYRIRYRLRGSDDEVMPTDFINGRDTSSYTIEDLEATGTYEFAIASLRSETEDGTYSEIVVYTLQCSVTVADLTEPVTGVNAQLDSVGGQRTVRLTWEASQETGVIGYLVNVDAVGSSTVEEGVQERVTAGTTYILPTDKCDGSLYTFTVSAYNECQGNGPSEQVSIMCSSEGFSPVTLSITTMRSSEFVLEVTIGTDAEVIEGSVVNINATTLSPSAPEIVTLQYRAQTSSLDAGDICIGGLDIDTYYNVCVSTDFVVGGENMVVCKQASTGSDVSSETTGCLTIIATSTAPRTRPNNFPDWAIAVIVVGVLAVVAILFCFIGLCFACNTSNSSKDDYDMGSISSLQTSVHPGSTVPPYISNHRNPSPQRSCLSYHKGGHSTNWNDQRDTIRRDEHRDTLREMNTDDGTTV